MYNYQLHGQIKNTLSTSGVDVEKNELFYTRFIANASAMHELFMELYGHRQDHEVLFQRVVHILAKANLERPRQFKVKDEEKQAQGHWYQSNKITGMSLYVDRFSDDLEGLKTKLAYLKKLGVNLLHLMPIFESPDGESDGGYAVSDFRKIESRFGDLGKLKEVQEEMSQEDMFLMIDIVLNHTSHQHQWAMKAKAGDKMYQDYFYMYDNRVIPDQFDQSMPEIFPESSPGNFTYCSECDKWVMSVFHHYQWDLNYSNPAVFEEMLDNIFFYANLGVDILRIDAPAFIWKEKGTNCQNLPKAHTILRLIKQCVQVGAPGMALLGEAIVAPAAIMKYFGTGSFTARECDFAYNATHMALQWDALATGTTRVMLAAQHELLQKPYGSSWITYTRCHDDIGLGYDDYMIEQGGFNPYEHRKFLKDFYSGNHSLSPARGSLFSVNPKTQDARISGSLASLCGLENAIEQNDEDAIENSIRKIILMQAHSFFLGGIPMIFYGDEAGYTNDYSYLQDEAKSYDNRWMHRPMINWKKNELTDKDETIEYRIFSDTQKLIAIRTKLDAIADHKNLVWLPPYNTHVAGYLRTYETQKVFCIFNFSSAPAYLTWYAFKPYGIVPDTLFDHWRGRKMKVGKDHEYLVVEPYSFYIMEQK